MTSRIPTVSKGAFGSTSRTLAGAPGEIRKETREATPAKSESRRLSTSNSTPGRSPLPANGEAETASERVKVVVRVRPQLEETECAGSLAISEDASRIVINRPDAVVMQSTFAFDKILGPEATQHDVYNMAVRDVVEDVLNGYNGTVMAYGQTGAGKTHTLGNVQPTAIGMIPRAVAEIFRRAAEDPLHHYGVGMSYIQIYMELIQDLLRPESENLQIREDLNGVFVAGVHEERVTSMEQCLHLLEQGERNRVFAFTHLNAHSSRSHAVVMLTVVKSKRTLSSAEKSKTAKDGTPQQRVKVGKLFLVDLAGSERLKKSKSTGLRAEEARSINLSLTTLGMCINARANDSSHVPFRDSKLTRLLQESLGGNAKTSLVICVRDDALHCDETLQSLQFGSRAMCVKNKPVVNERSDYKALQAELLAQLDVHKDKAFELEAVLLKTEEERLEMKEKLEDEQRKFQEIMDALMRETTQEAQVREKEIEVAKQQLEQHQQQIVAEKEAKSELQKQYEELKFENGQLLKDAAATAQAVADLHQNVESLKQLVAQAAVDQRQRQVQHESEMQELHSMHSAALIHLQGLLQQSQSMTSSLQGEKNNMQIEVNQLHMDKQQLEHVRSQLEVKVQGLESSKQNLEDLLATANSSVLMLQQALIKAAQMCSASCMSMQQSHADVQEQHRASLDKIQTHVSTVKRDLGQLRKDKSSLVRQAAGQCEVIADLESEIGAMRSTLVAREAVIGELQDEKVCLQDTIDDTLSKLEHSEQQVASSSVELSTALAEIVQLRTELDNILFLHAKEVNHTSDCEMRIQHLENENASLASSLLEEQSVRLQLEEKLSRTKDERAQLLEARAQARKRHVAALVIQRTWRRHKTRMLVTNLKTGSQALNQAHHKLENLNTQVEELEHKRKLLQQKSQAESAHLGAKLAQQSLIAFKDGVELIMTAFVLPRKELTSHLSVQQRIDKLSPLANASFSRNGSLQTMSWHNRSLAHNSTMPNERR